VKTDKKDTLILVRLLAGAANAASKRKKHPWKVITGPYDSPVRF
jgi:hypothetical protein